MPNLREFARYLSEGTGETPIEVRERELVEALADMLDCAQRLGIAIHRYIDSGITSERRNRLEDPRGVAPGDGHSST